MHNVQPESPKSKRPTTEQNKTAPSSEKTESEESAESEESEELPDECDSSPERQSSKRKKERHEKQRGHTKGKHCSKTHEVQQRESGDENATLSARVTELEKQAIQNQPSQHDLTGIPPLWTLPELSQQRPGYLVPPVRQQQFVMQAPAQQQQFALPFLMQQPPFQPQFQPQSQPQFQPPFQPQFQPQFMSQVAQHMSQSTAYPFLQGLYPNQSFAPALRQPDVALGQRVQLPFLGEGTLYFRPNS